MLDNEDSGSKEARPSLRGEIGRVVDIPEIDTDERGTAAHEEIEYLRLDVRPGLPVPGRPPALVPPVRMITARSLIVSLSSSSSSAPGCGEPSTTNPGMPATAASGSRLRSSPFSKR